jgi:hypothetical protein
MLDSQGFEPPTEEALVVSETADPAPLRIADLPHGLHLGIRAEVYYERALGVANASGLKMIATSTLAHFKAFMDGEQEDEAEEDGEEEENAALAFGTAFHCAVLEPAVFESSYVVEPKFGDCRKKENKAARDAWRAENGSKKQLSQASMRKILRMAASIRNHPVAGPLLERAHHEATLRWRDEMSGLECKARVDSVVEFGDKLLALDLKTTNDASPAGFAKSLANYGYAAQDAFYTDGFEAIGRPLHLFLFVAVEKTAPYLCAVYQVDGPSRAKGRATNREALRAYRDALEEDRWPGYSEDIETISLPKWAL